MTQETPPPTMHLTYEEYSELAAAIQESKDFKEYQRGAIYTKFLRRVQTALTPVSQRGPSQEELRHQWEEEQKRQAYETWQRFNQQFPQHAAQQNPEPELTPPQPPPPQKNPAKVYPLPPKQKMARVNAPTTNEGYDELEEEQGPDEDDF